MACCAVAAYVIMRMISVHESIKTQTDKITGGLESELVESCRIKITGITCPACVDTIETTLVSTSGLKKVTISRFLSQAIIEYLPKDVLVEEIVSKIEDLGYGAEHIVDTRDWVADIKDADEQRVRNIAEWKTNLYGSGIITFIIVLIGLLPGNIDIYLDLKSRLYIEAWLCAMVIVIFGRRIHHEAFLALKSRRSDMSLLTSLGILLSFVGSLYQLFAENRSDSTSFESTVILSCVAIGGRLLKSIVVRQSVSSVSSLASLMTESAAVLTGKSSEDGTITVPIEKLQIGDRIVVSPGDIILLDGTIIEGNGHVEETHVTGEILPVYRMIGSHIFAGSVNRDAHLVVKVTRVGHLTWLQHTLQLMADGDSKKASIQGIADFLAARFAGIILLLAMFTFVQTLWFQAGTWSLALNRVTAILLCACPCALSLASPTAVMIGLGILINAAFDKLVCTDNEPGSASKKRILIKGGSQSIEAAARVKTILFDKTGTLTTGKLSITAVEISSPWNSSNHLTLDWWSMILAAEQRSKHPIAQAITNEARRKLRESDSDRTLSEKKLKVVNFRNHLGSGVICEIQEITNNSGFQKSLQVIIGSKRFLEENDIVDVSETDIEDTCNGLRKYEGECSNGIDLFIAIDGVYAGRIRAADNVRPEAEETVQLLRSHGYRIGMMTGGTASAASSVAKRVGIHPDWVYSALLPKEKLRMITQIRTKYGPVAMVGDNLNDVQSMTAADFSIAAFADINSLTAITADTLLLDDDIPCSLTHNDTKGLLKVPCLFAISHKIYDKIWQNLLWAIVYNIVAVTLGMGMLEKFGITLSPVYAGLGMSLSSVFVITNAMGLEKEIAGISDSR